MADVHETISMGHAIAAIGYLSADLAAKAGAWDGDAPDWFPEPPEWLALFEEGLKVTCEDVNKAQREQLWTVEAEAEFGLWGDK